MMTNYIQFKGNNPFGSQAKMLYHLDRVQEYLTTGDTWPIFMEVNLTDRCNLNCEWCISENCRSKDTLDISILTKFIHAFAKNGGKAITWSGGGEPTLHPDFDILSCFATDEVDLGLMTNGCYSEKHNNTIGLAFEWVRFSVDTVDPVKYKKWKGVDCLERVKNNIHALKDYPVKVGVNCNVHPDLTQFDVEQLIDTFVDEVDYIQFRPILPRYFKDEKASFNTYAWQRACELKVKFGKKINLSNDKTTDIMSNNFFPFTRCEGHFFNPVLQANGDLTVCMYHPRDPRFVFGNIYQNTFEEIWKSERRQEVIRNLRQLDYSKECQACCKLTELNKFIDYIKHPDPTNDINFL